MCRSFDPSHIPFAHHGIMGSASRDKAQPLAITTKVDVTAQGEHVTGWRTLQMCRLSVLSACRDKAQPLAVTQGGRDCAR